METESLLCSSCGAILNFSGKSICTCEYCGVTNFLSGKGIKNVKKLNRANQYRQQRRFDDADKIYDEILDEVPPTVEVLWGKTLCRYGIEYVEDPVSAEKKPTLNRIEDEDIFECELYKEAFSLADEEQKVWLKKDAKEIADILKRYMYIASKEPPYDVFICYKDTDENGKPTDDKAKGLELYNHLTGYGLKVFFSGITMKEKLATEYEPYIFSALKSSTVMILLLCKEDYVNAVWLKNEWSRFLKLKENDPKKELFVACYDVGNLPGSFQRRECQILSEAGALGNLAFNVKNYISQKNPNRFAQDGRNGQNLHINANAEKIYKAALGHNQAGKFETSNEMVNKALEEAPAYAAAYWLRMCNSMRLHPEDLTKCRLDMSGYPDYINAVNCAEDDERQQFEKISLTCLENIECYRVFLEEKDRIVAEYAGDVREKDLHERLIQSGRTLAAKSDKNFLLSEPKPRKVIGIVIAIIIYVFVAICEMCLISVFKSNSFLIQNFGAGILFMTTIPMMICILILMDYLRIPWKVSLLILYWILHYAFGVVSLMIPDEVLYHFFHDMLEMQLTSGSDEFILIRNYVGIVDIVYFVPIVIGSIMTGSRYAKVSKARAEWDNLFIAYSNCILTDVNNAFYELQSERQLDFYPPGNLYRQINPENCTQLDKVIEEYLQEQCVYKDIRAAFL